MCGIAGYKTTQAVEPAVLEKMVEALYHRGTDSSGFYRIQRYSAGIRRLSINDLKTCDQSLFNEDKSVVLFYNVEIYNHLELREESRPNGCRLRTHSDGEIICYLYDEYGEALFEKLDGVFLARWIEREKSQRDSPKTKKLLS